MKLIISIIICELAGVVGYIFTAPVIGNWYKTLNKPFFNPPNWIFGPVWIILYFLMGVSLYLVWKKNWAVDVSKGIQPKTALNPVSQKLWTGSWRGKNVMAIFILQLILNIWWSLIFFGLKLTGFAFFEILMLWFAILYTIINFYRVSKSSAYLLLPYILWVSFAVILNFSIWMIN
jgi:benzodiazapine receptor